MLFGEKLKELGLEVTEAISDKTDYLEGCN